MMLRVPFLLVFGWLSWNHPDLFPSLQWSLLSLPPAAASPGDMGRQLQQTFNDLGLLYSLPCLQRGQLPLDLYRVMIRLVPPGEEESFLFR